MASIKSFLVGLLGRRQLPTEQVEVLIEEGREHHQRGELAAAGECYRQVLDRIPEHPLALFLLGTVEGQRGNLPRARQLLEHALAIDPEFADALGNLGNVALFEGRLEQATEAFRRAIALAPKNPDLYSNLSNALLGLGRLEEAERAARQALDLSPEHAEAYNNLGRAQIALGRPVEAVEALRRAIELAPGYAEAHCNLGAALQDQGQAEEAAKSYRRATELAPELAPAHDGLAAALKSLGDIEGAKRAYRLLLTTAPSGVTRLKLALTMPMVVSSVEEFAQLRRRLDDELSALLAQPPEISDPIREIGQPNFHLAYHGLDNRGLQEKFARLYAKTTPSLLYVAPHCRSGAGPQRRGGDGRLSVGIVSTSLCHHTIGYLTRGLLLGMDRRRFKVTLFLYRGLQDEFSNALRDAVERVVELPMDLGSAREIVAAEMLDALVYPDIGMHAATYFLAFARLAPFQCVLWGHPDTTGIPNMDWFVSSALIEPPGAEAHYSERLARLPHLNFHFERPTIPSPLASREALGLDPREHLYFCGQSYFKLHPEFDAFIAGILRQDPKGRVALVASHSDLETRALRERLSAGLPDVAERVDFIGRMSVPAFLNLAAVADVALDTIHFSATRSSADILATGTPIITLPGPFMRSRLTAGLYRQMGVEDCIARDRQDYVRRAVRLGTDPERRAEVRSRILDAGELLYARPEAARELGEFLESHAAGKAQADRR
jgi:predicted O-linked N-acetylglucosamine transferase (SPINDLY family)